MAGSVQVREGLQAGCSWSQELERLAARAEQLQAREVPPTLQELVDLAQDWLAYGFLSLTPAVVARSARLSVRLAVPVLAGVAPLDQQVDEIHATRWRVHSQAGGVTVRTVEEAPLPEALDPEPQPPPPALAAPRPLRPRSERTRMEPIHRTPQEIEALEQERQAARERREQRRAEHQAPAAEAPVVEQPEHQEALQKPRRQRRPSAAPPPGWFSADDAAEMLGAHSATVSRWRRLGRLGEEGTGWQKVGRAYYYAPDAVESLESGEIPAGFDALVEEVQTDSAPIASEERGNRDA